MTRLPIVALAILTGLSTAHADEAAHEPDLSEVARTLKPGQSFTRGDLKLTLHQRDAGIPDRDGWFLAKSYEGGFSVRFPAPFNDATTSVKADDGVIIKVHALASATEQGTRFLLNCFERQDSKFPDGLVDRHVQDMKGLGARFRSELFSRGAIAGKQYRGIDARGGHFAGQVFMARGQLCQFMAEFPETPFENIPSEVRTAFASFQPKSG